MRQRLATMPLLLAAALLLPLGTAAQETAEAVHPRAEYDRAAKIVMHEPNKELFVGTMHPAAALFMDYFDADKAAGEHRGYRQALADMGAEVVTVRDILLSGCTDAEGNTVEGQALDELRDFASRYLKYTCGEGVDSAEQAEYRSAMLAKFTPGDLVDIILLQPEVVLSGTGINTGLEASYTLHPVMNLFFMRDQAITTSKGVVIGRMNSSQRAAETDIAEFCYRKLGETPVYRISGEDAYLEGGDYLPFGSLSFIGCGLRTTQEAIDQLLDNDLIGKDTLVVVRDSWKSQDQMHLDTYFNIIDRDLVTLCANRVEAKPGDKDYLTADVYAKDGTGRFAKVSSGVPFTDFLTARGISIIPIGKADELNYANNFLTVSARKIAMVAGQSAELQQALAAHGVDVTWVPLYNLTRGYGAAHCMTQVVRRVPSGGAATGVSSAQAPGALGVKAVRGGIRLSSTVPVRVVVHNAAGARVADVTVSGSREVSVPSGAYVVSAGAAANPPLTVLVE